MIPYFLGCKLHCAYWRTTVHIYVQVRLFFCNFTASLERYLHNIVFHNTDMPFQQTASRDIQGRIVLCRSTLDAPSWLLILEWCLLSKSVTSKPLSETVTFMFLSLHPHCLGLHWAYHADDGAHLVDAAQDHPLLRVRSAIQLMSLFHCTVHRYHDMSSKHGLSNISYCFFICFGSLMQQGSTTVPAADSGWGTNYPEIKCVLGVLLSWGHCCSSRVLTGFWWLFVIVTVTTYCGNLVAFLTFPTIEYPISDLNTLVQKVSGPDVVRQ